MLSHLRLHFFGGDNTTLICSNSPQQVVTRLNIAVARWMENRTASFIHDSGGVMAYVYSQAKSLDNREKVGTFECVAWVQHYANAPITSAWSEGQRVMGNKGLSPGTAIATFVDGRYPNSAHGNHAAFYLGQVSNGIYVVDQWKDMATKPKISKRFIRTKGKNKSGQYIDPSNNADAFSVIE
jgi:hypothetical protein